MPYGTMTLNDGNKIPAIAYGTGSVMKGKDVAPYVEQALDCGFSHIDTAQIYGTEEATGRGIRESGLQRSEIYVTSKYLRGDIQHAIRDSLAKLDLKYLDLYLIHSPYLVDNFGSAWKEFEKIKKDGLAKSIGVSNFNLKQLQLLMATARIKPAVNQILLHPYNYAENKSLLQYAKLNNIAIEAYSSLTPITRRPGGPVDKPVSEAAKRRGVQPSQILLAWVRAKGAIIVTTSTSKQHLREYLDSADIEPLTSEEIVAIDAAGAKGLPMPMDDIVRRISAYLLPFILGALVYSLFRSLSR
ncbi:hypothetical protein AX17_006721 [Amanita inopinata Kibby_2008]|nr:hypothetical protein AX17_006721 [Amanita inopinata Kibby_2008]